MVVSSNIEREAAFDSWILRLVIRIFQKAARQNRFLFLVKGYCAEFVPIIDQRLLC